jgi:hypothetical protein
MIGAMLALMPSLATAQQAGDPARRIETAIEQARAVGVPASPRTGTAASTIEASAFRIR